MNKSILTVAIVAIILSLVIGLFNPSTSFDVSYSQSLSNSTLFVVAANSPGSLFHKINPKKHSKLFSSFKEKVQKTLAIDIDNIKSYEGFGINMSRPCGYAIVDITKDNQQLTAFFVSVSDNRKFSKALGEVFLKQNLTIEKTSFEVISVLSVKKDKKTVAICHFDRGFCIFYQCDLADDLETLARKSILSSNKLFLDAKFSDCVVNLDKNSDIYTYVDYEKIADHLKTQKSIDNVKNSKRVSDIEKNKDREGTDPKTGGTVPKKERTVPKDSQAEKKRENAEKFVSRAAIAMHIRKNSLEFTGYINTNEKATKDNKNLDSWKYVFPTIPFLCFATSSNHKDNWENTQNYLNNISSATFDLQWLNNIQSIQLRHSDLFAINWHAEHYKLGIKIFSQTSIKPDFLTTLLTRENDKLK